MKHASHFQFSDIQGFKFGSDPFGKPRMFSHAYLVDGLLIDTAHRNVRKLALEAFSPLSIEQIFITHHHEDHTANIQPLVQRFNCPVYGSALCAEMMKNPPAISPAQRIYWGDRPAFGDIIVAENQIQTANYCFDLIPIPGHAPDMLALHEASQGWLFSADLWVYDYIRYFMRTERMKAQIDSLKRVLTLDFEVLLCSHNPQFSGGKQRIRNKLQFLEDFYGRVAAFAQEGMSAHQIMKAMQLKEQKMIKTISLGALSTFNMVRAVMRDEGM